MKIIADNAKKELIKERAKNSQLQKHLQQYVHKEPDKRVDELADELRELTKCFEKSEMIRKQQKILINKMKQQMEELQVTNDELRKRSQSKPKKKKKTSTTNK